MTGITFRFDRAKAIESILYLSPRVSPSDIYGICKLLYLADKCSLSNYGRFVFGETYTAMIAGATPSNAYDLLKEAQLGLVSEVTVIGNDVKANRDADMRCLSDSDIECLDEIIGLWGHRSNRARGEAAHDDAWAKAWDSRGAKNSATIPVESVVELVDQSGELLAYVANSDSD